MMVFLCLQHIFNRSALFFKPSYFCTAPFPLRSRGESFAFEVSFPSNALLAVGFSNASQNRVVLKEVPISWLFFLLG